MVNLGNRRALFSKGLDKLTTHKFLRVERRHAPVPMVMRMTELTILLLIIIFLAKLFWTIVAPLPLPYGAVATQSNIFESRVNKLNSDPFSLNAAAAGVGNSENGTILSETSLDLTLYGTWPANNGGAAFVGEGDDTQKRYSIGDNISSGVVLREVHENWVVISRNGVRESLWLKNRKQLGDSRSDLSKISRAQVQRPTNGAPLHTNEFGDVFRLDIVTGDNGAPKIVLNAGPNVKRFAALGFATGDVLAAIDGVPINASTFASGAMMQMISGKQSIRLTIERNGVPKIIDVELSGASNSGGSVEDDA